MFKDSRTLIWSETPDKLMEFYRDVLELELVDKVDIKAKDGLEKDYGYMFQLTPTAKFFIGHHGDIKGSATYPEQVRVMHNLYTDDVQEWYEKIEKATKDPKWEGCKILLKPIKTPFYSDELPWYVSTFIDPEGNCWQFMGTLQESMK